MNAQYEKMLKHFTDVGLYDNLRSAREAGQTPLIDGMAAFMLAKNFGEGNLKTFCEQESVTLSFPSMAQRKNVTTGHSFIRNEDELIDMGDRRD